MFGGVGKSAGWAAILGAVGVVLGGSVSATAADLGGDCCADLEERVAELEATTARKGNRKVSLKISGWVNEAVFWWDDGLEKNVYVGTNKLEQTRFRFTGEAKIDKDWSAGYNIEIGIVGADSSKFSQDSEADALANSLSIRKSYWYLKSKTYGTFAVGQNGTATYHLLDDADATNTRNFSDAQAAAVAVNSFFLITNGVRSTTKWSDVLRGFDNRTEGQSGRRNVVRYDSPVWEGFAVSAAWGEDDLWDAALTYNKEIGDFKLVGKVGYGESTDNVATGCGGSSADFRCRWGGVAGTVMHKPTGLYVYGGWGKQTIDNATIPVTADKDSTTWFIQPGIEHKWLPLGKTTVFGEYRHDDAGANLDGKNAFVTHGADINFWAGGVVQNIEAAAMDLYVIYRHADGDYRNKADVLTNIDNFDMVIGGAMIQF